VRVAILILAAQSMMEISSKTPVKAEGKRSTGRSPGKIAPEGVVDLTATENMSEKIIDWVKKQPQAVLTPLWVSSFSFCSLKGFTIDMATSCFVRRRLFWFGDVSFGSATSLLVQRRLFWFGDAFGDVSNRVTLQKSIDFTDPHRRSSPPLRPRASSSTRR
jgi:hypothetical protein